jgi:hypothetical protein
MFGTWDSNREDKVWRLRQNEEDREGRERTQRRDEKRCCSVLRVKGRGRSRQVRGNLGWVGFFLSPECRILCPTLNFGFASSVIWGEVMTFCEKNWGCDNPRANLNNGFWRRIINITVVSKCPILNRDLQLRAHWTMEMSFGGKAFAFWRDIWRFGEFSCFQNFATNSYHGIRSNMSCYIHHRPKQSCKLELQDWGK